MEHLIEKPNADQVGTHLLAPPVYDDPIYEVKKTILHSEKEAWEVIDFMELKLNETALFLKKESSFCGEIGELFKNYSGFAKEVDDAENIDQLMTQEFLEVFSRQLSPLDELIMSRSWPKAQVCGKALSSTSDNVFRCMECSAGPNSIICGDCYEPKKHEGHTTWMEEVGGVCDCGDSGSFKPQGFCSKHKGHMTPAEEASLSISEETTHHVRTFIRDAFQAIFSFAELLELGRVEFEANQTGSPSPSQVVQVWMKTHQHYTEVLEAALYSILLQKMDCPAVLLAVLRAVLAEPIRAFQFKHVCSEFSKCLKRKERGPCNCCPIDLIFRFAIPIGKSQDSIRENFIYSFLKFERAKPALSDAFLKNQRFLSETIYTCDSIEMLRDETSGLKNQIYVIENVLVYALKSPRLIDGLEITLKYIKAFFKRYHSNGEGLLQIKHEFSNCYDIHNFLVDELLKREKFAEELWLFPGFAKKLIEVIGEIQRGAQFSPRDSMLYDTDIFKGIIFEIYLMGYNLEEWIQFGFKSIAKLPKGPKKNKIIELIVKAVLSEYQKKETLERNQKERSYFQPLPIILWFCVAVAPEAVKIQDLPHGTVLIQRKILPDLCNTLGFYSELYSNVWDNQYGALLPHIVTLNCKKFYPTTLAAFQYFLSQIPPPYSPYSDAISLILSGQFSPLLEGIYLGNISTIEDESLLKAGLESLTKSLEKDKKKQLVFISAINVIIETFSSSLHMAQIFLSLGVEDNRKSVEEASRLVETVVFYRQTYKMDQLQKILENVLHYSQNFDEPIEMVCHLSNERLILKNEDRALTRIEPFLLLHARKGFSAISEEMSYFASSRPHYRTALMGQVSPPEPGFDYIREMRKAFKRTDIIAAVVGAVAENPQMETLFRHSLKLLSFLLVSDLQRSRTIFQTKKHLVEKVIKGVMSFKAPEGSKIKENVVETLSKFLPLPNLKANAKNLAGEKEMADMEMKKKVRERQEALRKMNAKKLSQAAINFILKEGEGMQEENKEEAHLDSENCPFCFQTLKADDDQVVLVEIGSQSEALTWWLKKIGASHVYTQENQIMTWLKIKPLSFSFNSCNHRFHKACYKKEKEIRNVMCPICKFFSLTSFPVPQTYAPIQEEAAVSLKEITENLETFKSFPLFSEGFPVIKNPEELIQKITNNNYLSKIPVEKMGDFLRLSFKLIPDLVRIGGVKHFVSKSLNANAIVFRIYQSFFLQNPKFFPDELSLIKDLMESDHLANKITGLAFVVYNPFVLFKLFRVTIQSYLIELGTFLHKSSSSSLPLEVFLSSFNPTLHTVLSEAFISASVFLKFSPKEVKVAPILSLKKEQRYKFMLDSLGISFTSSIIPVEISSSQASFFGKLSSDLAKEKSLMIMDLPETLCEFHCHFGKLACINCGKCTDKMAICLLCRQPICTKDCNSLRKGSLTKHMMLEHQGMSLFLVIKRCTLVFMTLKIVLEDLRPVYKDKFGRSFRDLVKSKGDISKLRVDQIIVRKAIKEVMAGYGLQKALLLNQIHGGVFVQVGEL